MSKRIDRINSVKNLTFILSAVLGQVSKNMALNAAEKKLHKAASGTATVTPYYRGWLNTFRWAAFKLSILIPLAFFGLVKVPGSSQEVALRVFVWDTNDRLRSANLLNPYTHGARDAWRSWNIELQRERVTELNNRSTLHTNATV